MTLNIGNRAFHAPCIVYSICLATDVENLEREKFTLLLKNTAAAIKSLRKIYNIICNTWKILPDLCNKLKKFAFVRKIDINIIYKIYNINSNDSK